MSLLYDALRKKQKAESRLTLPDQDNSAPPGRKGRLVVAALLVCVLTFGGYFFYRYLGEIAGDDFVAAPPPASPSVPAAGSATVATPEENPVEEKAAGTAVAVPATVSTASAQTASQSIATERREEKEEKPAASSVSPRRAVRPQRKIAVASGDRTATNPAAERYMRKAKDFHRRDEPGGAISLYQEVLARAPKHGDAHLNLAAAYLEERRFDEAAAVLEEMRQQTGDSAALLVNLAIAALGKNDPDRALTLLDRSAGLAGASQFSILLHRGVAHGMKGDLAAAIAAYEQALVLGPDDETLLFNRAVAYDKAERYEKAVVAYQDFLNKNGEVVRRQKKAVEERLRQLKLSNF